MAKSKKTRKTSKPSVKVQDLTPQANPKGGGVTVRKAGGEQQEYLKVTLSDVLISS